MKKNYFFLGFLILLATAACTKVINIELAELEEPILVVDASITNLARPDSIILTYTSDYYSSENAPVESTAKVSITVDDSVFVFPHLDEKPGYYIRPDNFMPVSGKEYLLEIEVDGKTYASRSFMAEVPPIDSIGHRRLAEDRTIGGGQIELTISFQDPPGVSNFYLYRLMVNDTFPQGTLIDYAIIFDDFILQGQYAELIPFGLFDLAENDTITLFAHSMDALSYEIYNGLLAEAEFRGGLFDAPASNVPSNISGGAVGLFVMHDVKSRSIIIRE